MVGRLSSILLLLCVLAGCDRLVAPDEKAALGFFCSGKSFEPAKAVTPADRQFCLDRIEVIDDGETWQVQLKRQYWRCKSTGFYGQSIFSVSKKTGKIISHAIAD